VFEFNKGPVLAILNDHSKESQVKKEGIAVCLKLDKVGDFSGKVLENYCNMVFALLEPLSDKQFDDGFFELIMGSLGGKLKEKQATMASLKKKWKGKQVTIAAAEAELKDFEKTIGNHFIPFIANKFGTEKSRQTLNSWLRKHLNYTYFELAEEELLKASLVLSTAKKLLPFKNYIRHAFRERLVQDKWNENEEGDQEMAFRNGVALILKNAKEMSDCGDSSIQSQKIILLECLYSELANIKYRVLDQMQRWAGKEFLEGNIDFILNNLKGVCLDGEDGNVVTILQNFSKQPVDRGLDDKWLQNCVELGTRTKNIVLSLAKAHPKNCLYLLGKIELSEPPTPDEDEEDDDFYEVELVHSKSEPRQAKRKSRRFSSASKDNMMSNLAGLLETYEKVEAEESEETEPSKASTFTVATIVESLLACDDIETVSGWVECLEKIKTDGFFGDTNPVEETFYQEKREQLVEHVRGLKAASSEREARALLVQAIIGPKGLAPAKSSSVESGKWQGSAAGTEQVSMDALIAGAGSFGGGGKGSEARPAAKEEGAAAATQKTDGAAAASNVFGGA